MSATTTASPAARATAAADVPRTLAPMVLLVFLGFLAVGTPLSALSLHVHDALGFSATTVGLALGVQSLATGRTRHRAGVFSDRHGPKRAVLLGLPLAALAGLFYAASTLIPSADGALALLLAGRVVLGFGESLFITGALSWGIGRLGVAHAGKVISWQGIAMYAAIGLGAPLGLAVQGALGFAVVGALAAVTPLVAWLIALALPASASGGSGRVPFYRVLGLIWRPGLVLALATAPFAAMAAFVALDFAARGWTNAGLALVGFGAGYVAIRLFFAHLPDRFGGARVAAVSLVIEATGQALLWLAPNPVVALLGALVTGAGFSLVFPAMGVETARRVPPDQRGRALGNFTAFFDLSLLLTAPLVGLAARAAGYSVVFAIGAFAALLALALLPGLRRMSVAGAGGMR
jgi:MFS family permease